VNAMQLTSVAPGLSTSYDEHHEKSRQAQAKADKWLIAGTIIIGTGILGFIGFPIFVRGLTMLRKASREGLSVRPIICTLIGYLVIMDSALNSMGWAMDLLANHSLVTSSWGALFDGGYYWHYNELGIGGAGAPGEKAWEIALIPTVFCMRLAAAIGFLQMKRWGHQWLVVTCYFGMIVWVGYNTNMIIFADVRFAHVTFPVIGWWMYDIFYITPFLSIPYLHTVNRELFTD
jgi:hypothetical protein